MRTGDRRKRAGVRYAARELRLQRSGHFFRQHGQRITGNVNLILRCPFCGKQHSDDWECLDPRGPEFLRCENAACLMSFAFLIHECSSCASESVYTWKEKPDGAALARLLCQHCAEPVRETSRETQAADPPE
jgi:hypothetical protein